MRLATILPALVAGLALALPACKKEVEVVRPHGETEVVDRAMLAKPADHPPEVAEPAPPTVRSAPPAVGEGTEVTLEILGLHCEEDCVPRVQAMLEHARGVESASVDFAARSAVVTIRPGTDPADIAAAVQGGFSASVR